MKVIQKTGVQIPYLPTLSVDAEALNNEALVHAYNPSGREKEVHNTILRGSTTPSRTTLESFTKCGDLALNHSPSKEGFFCG